MAYKWWLKVVFAGWLVACPGAGMRAAAPATPQADAKDSADPQAKAKALLVQMVTAMGGPTWKQRGTERLEGRSASFYKGQPNPYESQFEQYIRVKPFGERVVVVSKMGVFIPTTKRDVAEVWTADSGYLVTFRGRKELPKAEVEEFFRRQRHSLDTVVGEWLEKPDAFLTFEGTQMDERRLVDKISVITATNDAVTLTLDHETHLPRSRSFQWRDATYKDLDTDLERYDDWQAMGGIMTPMTTTRYRNGDMVGQRFLTKVQYGLPLSADLFDPDRPLNKK